MNQKEFAALVAETEGLIPWALFVKDKTQVYIEVPEHRYTDPENHPPQQKVLAQTRQTGFFSGQQQEGFAKAFSTYPEFRQEAVDARFKGEVLAKALKALIPVAEAAVNATPTSEHRDEMTSKIINARAALEAVSL